MATIKREVNSASDPIVNNNVKDRGNDPYFIKKAEKAKEILQRVGIPGKKKLDFK